MRLTVAISGYSGSGKTTLIEALLPRLATRGLRVGVLKHDTHRLALMNAMLHDIQGDLLMGDTLSPRGTELPKADVILTNPPFGTKKGGGRSPRPLPISPSRGSS